MTEGKKKCDLVEGRRSSPVLNHLSCHPTVAGKVWESLALERKAVISWGTHQKKNFPISRGDRRFRHCLLKLSEARLVFLVMTLVNVQDPHLIPYSETYIIQIAILYFMLLCSFGPLLLMD